jgi:hypothetical protein
MDKLLDYVYKNTLNDMRSLWQRDDRKDCMKKIDDFDVAALMFDLRLCHLAAMIRLKRIKL